MDKRKLHIILFYVLISIPLILLSFKSEPVTTAQNIEARYLRYAKTFSQQIVFPDSLINLKNSKTVNVNRRYSNKLKILNFISLRCKTCVDNLSGWEKYKNSFKDRTSLAFIFIASSIPQKYAQYILKEEVKFDLVVYYDKKRIILKENIIPEVPSTLLLDQKNNVVFAGSPILHVELREIYKNRIDSLLEQKK